MLTNTLCLLGAEYSASQFFKDARAATELVLARNRVPIVVGGTCTYLRWYGHHRLPAQAFTGARAVVITCAAGARAVCYNCVTPGGID